MWNSVGRLNVTRRVAIFMGAALLSISSAGAQNSFPSRTVTFVCAFAPGGGADTLVRYFASKISEQTGHNIIVENKPGAAGVVAAEYTARSASDGHTIFVHAGTTVAGNMWLLKNPPVDGANDLRTVATTHKQPMMITVRADSPYQTLEDLVEDQKQKGEAGSYATNSTSGIVLAEEFKQVAGLDTVRVMYGSSGESLNDMVAGLVDFGVHDPAFSLAQVREGRFRVLAIGSEERLESTGDLPTFKEQGYEIDQLGWWGAMVPAAVSDEVVDQINGWFRDMLSDQETREILAQSGGDVWITTPDEAHTMMEESVEEWKRLVEISGIEPQ